LPITALQAPSLPQAELPQVTTSQVAAGPELARAQAVSAPVALDRTQQLLASLPQTQTSEPGGMLTHVPAESLPQAARPDAAQSMPADVSVASIASSSAGAEREVGLGVLPRGASAQSERRARREQLGSLNRGVWNQPLSESRYRIQFTADQALRDKLERAQALSAHPVRRDDIATVIDAALDLLIAERRAARFGFRRPRRRSRSASGRRDAARVEVTPAPCADSDARGVDADSQELRAGLGAESSAQAPRVSTGASRRGEQVAEDSAERARVKGDHSRSVPHEEASRRSPVSRYVPRAVRRAVVAREGERCCFMSADGRRCAERGALQFDHRNRAFARGGEARVENLQLLCRVHNRLMAEREFGRELVRVRIAARRAEARVARGDVRPHAQSRAC
jgi:hypothetical protein